MTRTGCCAACGATSAVPDALAEGATAFACPYCGSAVPVPATAARRATVRRVELPEASIPTVTPAPVPLALSRSRAASGAAWRVGGVSVVALVAALGLTGHVVWRILAPEPVVEPMVVVPRPPPVAAPTPTNLTRPPPRPRLVAPTESDAPAAVVADWRAEWTPFEPAGLKLRVSLPGERRRRTINFPTADGSVVAVGEDSGDEGPARYRVIALPSAGGTLTPAALTRLLAGLRPDVTVPAKVVTLGGQKCVTVQFLAYDGRDWTVHAVVRGAKVVLLVRSLDADKVVNAAGFDAEAAHRRFLASVELLPSD